MAQKDNAYKAKVCFVTHIVPSLTRKAVKVFDLNLFHSIGPVIKFFGHQRGLNKQSVFRYGLDCLTDTLLHDI